MQNNNAYNLQLAKTLFENTYAARVLNDNQRHYRQAAYCTLPAA